MTYIYYQQNAGGERLYTFNQPCTILSEMVSGAYFVTTLPRSHFFGIRRLREEGEGLILTYLRMNCEEIRTFGILKQAKLR